MKTKVLAIVGEDDYFVDDVDIKFYIDSKKKPRLSVNRVWELIDRNHLEPSQDGIDWFRFSASIYTCDLRISRSSGYDDWTREIELHFPVNDIDRWNASKDRIEKLVGFLTGDVWHFEFYQTAFKRPSKPRYIKTYPKVNTNLVSLFSGGLDSYIGVNNLMAKDKSIYLVSHYDNTSKQHAKPAQNRSIENLSEIYEDCEFRHLNFFVNAPKEISNISESTTRSRSIIFMGLGILVASSLGEKGKLYVPENGFIALNVPLGNSRIGSFSTRTTHPYTLELMNQVMDKLNISVNLVNQYYYETKGEMIESMENKAEVKDTLENTVSCSHPSTRRFNKSIEGGAGHCGYCYPCLIRRAAMKKNNLDDSSNYAFDLTIKENIDELSSIRRKDVKALYNAIKREKKFNASIVLKPGPINSKIYNIEGLYKMYQNGLQEISILLP